MRGFPRSPTRFRDWQANPLRAHYPGHAIASQIDAVPTLREPVGAAIPSEVTRCQIGSHFSQKRRKNKTKEQMSQLFLPVLFLLRFVSLNLGIAYGIWPSDFDPRECRDVS